MFPEKNKPAFHKSLQAWFQAQGRSLPWRDDPAPYRVLVSEFMLQQTTVAAVRGHFARWMRELPDVQTLAAAPEEKVLKLWEGLGYYSRARNLHRAAKAIVTNFAGRIPDDPAQLRTLPGIGPYTAAAIAAIAFDRPAAVMDGNVERVLARVFAVETPLPAAKPALRALAERLTPATRPGCYAQAVMDLGATVCTPKSPACGICPLMQMCRARAQGIAPDLPRKAPKKETPTRHGIAYLVRRTDGAVLLETRPETGLLGGMLGWPGTTWAEGAPQDAPPIDANWHDPGLEVRHTFTHFHLRLALRLATVPMDATPDRGAFHPRATFRPASLPTVMRKAWDLASGAWPED